MSTVKYVRVASVMTTPPLVIDGLATVEEAMATMRRENVSSLVIDKRHQGDEYGLLVVTDIAAKVIARNRSPARTSVYEAMSKPVLTLGGDMDVKYAVRLLARFALSRALVLEGGRLAGIVTMRDMVLRTPAEATGA